MLVTQALACQHVNSVNMPVQILHQHYGNEHVYLPAHVHSPVFQQRQYRMHRLILLDHR